MKVEGKTIHLHHIEQGGKGWLLPLGLKDLFAQTAPGADPLLGQLLEGCTRSNAILGIPLRRVVDIVTCRTSVLFHCRKLIVKVYVKIKVCCEAEPRQIGDKQKRCELTIAPRHKDVGQYGNVEQDDVCQTGDG